MALVATSTRSSYDTRTHLSSSWIPTSAVIGPVTWARPPKWSMWPWVMMTRSTSRNPRDSPNSRRIASKPSKMCRVESP